MKQFSTLYTSPTLLQELIETSGLKETDPVVVRVVTSNLTRCEVEALIGDIKTRLPKAKILGMTSSTAVIHKSQIEEGQTLISLELYEKSTLYSSFFTYEDKSLKELAEEIYNHHLPSVQGGGLVNILFPPHFRYISELLEELNGYETPIRLAGGVVGFLPDGDEGFAFDEMGIYDDRIFTFAFTGEDDHHFLATNVSYEAIEEEIQTITAIDHDEILEMNGIPAKDWIKGYADLEHHQFPLDDELLAHFPLVIHEGKSSRFLRYDPQTGQVFIHRESSLPQGTTFRKGCISPNYTMENTHSSLISVLDTPIESMFVFACLFRKIYLCNCIHWELKPFSGFSVNGMCAMGEISFEDGENRLHHGSSIFTGIAEVDTYIVPEMAAFRNTQLLEESLDEMSIALHMASPETSPKPAQIRLHGGKERMVEYFHDPHLEIPNLFQFEIDKDLRDYDKICIIEVGTADMIIAFTGMETYYRLYKECLEDLNNGFRFASRHAKGIACYSFNYKTVFFACSKEIPQEEFLTLSSQIHKKFEHTTSTNREVTFSLRFTLVASKENLLKDGIRHLFEQKGNSDTFLLCNEHTNTDSSEIHVVNLIKWAIDHDGIVPFYQGLYNNDTGCIDKYEALMRIRDSEGKIHPPFSFLEISHKYNLYNKISMKMIERVLADFRNRKEKISLNISLQDVQVDHFRLWLLDKLRNFPEPERITIEVLESDDFKGNITFSEFLLQLKELRCKVAVDDFGTGYSTFVTISQIKPDYIKIDGSIIKNVAKDPDSVALLDAISYFSTKMKASTVGEFVEDEEIQKVLMDYGINYSQGYYFSKPSPLEELGKVKA